MSSVARNLYRKKLSNILELADDEEMMILMWDIMNLRLGKTEKLRTLAHYPAGAVAPDMGSNLYIAPWTVETLINELLTIPKSKMKLGKRVRSLNTKTFESVRRIVSLLLKYENGDDGIFLETNNVVSGMYRLGQRQFEWQRGYLNLTSYYRSHFIFGGPLSTDYFYHANAFSIQDFSLTCFGMRAIYLDYPGMLNNAKSNLALLGIGADLQEAVVRKVSLQIDQIRARATDLRQGARHVAYKPSILRRYPCICFSGKPERVYAPLPELLTLRSTNDVYYDVIGGGDNLRNEIGHRFEVYSLDLLSSTLRNHNFCSSINYKLKKRTFDTPDILGFNGSLLDIVIECKATKASFDARFSGQQVEDARRGLAEIGKGIFQIWRYISHVRNRLIEVELTAAPAAVVLTLDNWSAMSVEFKSRAVEFARKLSLSDQMISTADQIAVAIISIEDLEYTLGHCSPDETAIVLRDAAKPQFDGWFLSNILNLIQKDGDREANKHPFLDKINDVVPWWSTLQRWRSPTA